MVPKISILEWFPGSNIWRKDTIFCLGCHVFIVLVVLSHERYSGSLMYRKKQCSTGPIHEVCSAPLPFTIFSEILNAHFTKRSTVSAITRFSVCLHQLLLPTEIRAHKWPTVVSYQLSSSDWTPSQHASLSILTWYCRLLYKIASRSAANGKQ